MVKLFSVDEANQLLPAVNEILERVRVHGTELEESRQVLAAAGEKARSNGHAPGADTVSQTAERAAHEIRRAVQELGALGCEVKDPMRGLVDFPSLREGREVYLCWQFGEDQVAWWHERSDGFAGRQPL